MAKTVVKTKTKTKTKTAIGPTLVVGLGAIGAAIWWSQKQPASALTVGAVTTGTAALMGTVLDGRVQSALLGVRVEAGGRSGVTDATGKFMLMGVPVSSGCVILVSVEGYDTFAFTIPVIPGYNDVGTIELLPLRAEATVSGLLIDSGSGLPLAGAVVNAQGRSAITNSSGRFSIGSLLAVRDEIIIAAAGYPQYVVTVNLQRGENDIGVLPISK